MIKLLRDKRGFSLIETLMAGALGAMITATAILGPVMALKAVKGYEEVISQREDFQVVIIALREDHKTSMENSYWDGERLTVGSSTYTFGDDGVVRNGKTLTTSPVHLTPSPTHFTLTFPSSITLSFNYSQSSFKGGGDSE